MIPKKSIIKGAWPYQKDKMNLPVHNLEVALPFYKNILGFQLILRNDSPIKSAILERNGIQIGLAENGGDPSQDGCFFEVDNSENAFEELRTNGLEKEMSGSKIERHGHSTWKVFYVAAPDGLCYCFGERQS